MGRLCEKAERGMTVSHPASTAFIFKSPLQVIEKANDRNGLLELALELGNQRHGLGVEVVEIEDHQPWLFALRRLEDARDSILIFALDEFNFHAEFSRGFLNLGEEEEILNEAKDAGRSIFAHRRGGLGGIDVGIISSAVAIAGPGNGGGRTVGYVAIHGSIAMIHGTDKHTRPLLASPALALLRPGNAVPGLCRHRRRLLEEFLLPIVALVLVGRLVRRGLRWPFGLRLGRPLRLLILHSGLLV